MHTLFFQKSVNNFEIARHVIFQLGVWYPFRQKHTTYNTFTKSICFSWIVLNPVVFVFRDSMDEALTKLREEVKELRENEKEKLEEEKETALEKINKEVEEVKEKRRKELEAENQKVRTSLIVCTFGTG